jgi:hypothetical protein
MAWGTLHHHCRPRQRTISSTYTSTAWPAVSVAVWLSATWWPLRRWQFCRFLTPSTIAIEPAYRLQRRGTIGMALLPPSQPAEACLPRPLRASLLQPLALLTNHHHLLCIRTHHWHTIHLLWVRQWPWVSGISAVRRNYWGTARQYQNVLLSPLTRMSPAPPSHTATQSRLPLLSPRRCYHHYWSCPHGHHGTCWAWLHWLHWCLLQRHRRSLPAYRHPLVRVLLLQWLEPSPVTLIELFAKKNVAKNYTHCFRCCMAESR